MPIDLAAERILSLGEACRDLPKIAGKRPHPSTIWRWCRVGVRARSGQRVRLEHARLGHRIVVSREALGRFANRLAEADTEREVLPASPRRSRTQKQRIRDIARAEAELAEAGI